ncbi:IS110 family transposase [Bradyrhizobium cenepequi]|uniref:IS110 family transposase n=1 Tax=Bradyrhizobium cenepequi TaxID=2821403 RepID=UPI001CE262B4|nr:transposase [Bradyrhizobium cenepequi]
MKQYFGLDISMEETSICVLDENGGVTFEGNAPTDPEAIAKLLRRHAGNAERIVFETGSLSNWLWRQLRTLGFPFICLDARHANAALSMRINKSDQNDAKGLAEMARTGWYWQVAVKRGGELEHPFDAGGSNQVGESAARPRQPDARSV